MTETTVTVKGQVTIPKDIRNHLGLKNGDKVVFAFEGDRAVLFPVKGDLLNLRGLLKKHSKNQSLNMKSLRVNAKAFITENYIKKRAGNLK